MTNSPLNISVLEHEQQSRRPMFNVGPFESQEPNVTLNKHKLPRPEELVHWSACHADNRGITDLQSALDSFLSACSVRRDVPQVCHVGLSEPRSNCAD